MFLCQNTCSFFWQEIDVTAKDHSADDNSKSSNTESIWVEGLVPGIDFCNHSKGSIFNSSTLTKYCLFFDNKVNMYDVSLV
jgi:hypothetical protein